MQQIQKVLVAGDFQYDMYDKALADGFSQCGLQTHTHAFSPYFKNPGLLKRIQRKVMQGPLFARINRDFIQKIESVKPDMVFLNRPTHIDAHAIDHFSSQPILFVCNNHDNPMTSKKHKAEWKKFFAIARRCDFTFFASEYCVAQAHKYGITRSARLMQYYVEGMHYPKKSDEPYTHEVTFIGHFENDGRAELLEFLCRHSIPLHIAGPHWRVPDGLRKVYPHPIVPIINDEYRRALAQSRISLVVFSGMNQDTCTTRCFEIPACGSMMLAPKNKDICSLFKEGKEADFYSSKEELRYKINYYLSHERVRAEIANAGHDRVIRDNHSNIGRVTQVLQRIAQADL